MKLFSKNNKKNNETHRLPMGNRNKHVLATYAVLVLTFDCSTAITFAASNPLTVINNLFEFIFDLIHAIGMILLGFGIVQVGLSLKSHDPSQRANDFFTLAGGVIITFAKEVSTLTTS